MKKRYPVTGVQVYYSEAMVEMIRQFIEQNIPYCGEEDFEVSEDLLLLVEQEILRIKTERKRMKIPLQQYSKYYKPTKVKID